jgi:RIO-like serine/threonine protein kinase
MAKRITFESPFDIYSVSEVIGEGGAGLVYGVTNAAGEPFALKCLAPARITAERLKRFKNEVQDS